VRYWLLCNTGPVKAQENGRGLLNGPVAMITARDTNCLKGVSVTHTSSSRRTDKTGVPNNGSILNRKA
jgi:hypothetical protein